MMGHNIRFCSEIRKIIFELSSIPTSSLELCDGMVNGVDHDETAPERSDLGLHCFLRPIYTSI